MSLLGADLSWAGLPMPAVHRCRGPAMGFSPLPPHLTPGYSWTIHLLFTALSQKLVQCRLYRTPIMAHGPAPGVQLLHEIESTALPT
eukprot:superscaffoldBa00002167_g13411